jgi:hypothetical protein
VLGEVTSISVDSKDHIWVLHVPQSVPQAQRANAAPPVLEFDAAGKLLASWGGPGDGFEWPEREHGIFVDANDFVWIGGRGGWPRPATPGSSDDMILKFTMAGKFVMQIDHGQSKGNTDTVIHQPTDTFVSFAEEVYSPTVTAISAWWCSIQKPGSSSACGAHSATCRADPWLDPAIRSRRPLPRTAGLRAAALGKCHVTASSTCGPDQQRIRCSRPPGSHQAGSRHERGTVVPVPPVSRSRRRQQQFLHVVDSGRCAWWFLIARR